MSNRKQDPARVALSAWRKARDARVRAERARDRAMKRESRALSVWDVRHREIEQAIGSALGRVNECIDAERAAKAAFDSAMGA